MVAVALLEGDTPEQEGDTLEQEDMVVALGVYTLLVGEGSLQQWVGLVAALVVDNLKETSTLLFLLLPEHSMCMCVYVCARVRVHVCVCACIDNIYLYPVFKETFCIVLVNTFPV